MPPALPSQSDIDVVPELFIVCEVANQFKKTRVALPTGDEWLKRDLVQAMGKVGPDGLLHNRPKNGDTKTRQDSYPVSIPRIYHRGHGVISGLPDDQFREVCKTHSTDSFIVWPDDFAARGEEVAVYHVLWKTSQLTKFLVQQHNPEEGDDDVPSSPCRKLMKDELLETFKQAADKRVDRLLTPPSAVIIQNIGRNEIVGEKKTVDDIVKFPQLEEVILGVTASAEYSEELQWVEASETTLVICSCLVLVIGIILLGLSSQRQN
jgi:hypothetical protein